MTVVYCLFFKAGAKVYGGSASYFYMIELESHLYKIHKDFCYNLVSGAAIKTFISLFIGSFYYLYFSIILRNYYK